MTTSTSNTMLDEGMFGRDDVAIAFPNLLLCMGFVLRTNTALWGVHLDTPEYSGTVIGPFWTWCANKGLVSADITDIFGVCHFKERYKKASNDANVADWRTEMARLATACGFTGQAHGFDTNVVLGREKGAYIEYVNNTGGNRNCKVYYKRQSKVDRTGIDFKVPSNPNDDIVQYKNGAIQPFVSKAHGYSGKTADGHKGLFHDADSRALADYKVRFETIRV